MGSERAAEDWTLDRRPGAIGLDQPTWVFGYGSLIYKVDFPYLARDTALVEGWGRRFWQGSHDHRGTPQAPGRVVTLVPEPGRRCRGVAYLVAPDTFAHLDHREKNGYRRRLLSIQRAGQQEPTLAVTYVAEPDNPAFLGPAPLPELAAQIAAARGPSGSNRDYLLRLAAALETLGDDDPHVRALSRLIGGNEH